MGSSYFPAEQGLPGKQIGVGSPPDVPIAPTGQLTSGLQGGMGLDGRAPAPNAVAIITIRIPIMIAFTCFSSAAVAAWHGF